MKYRPKPRVIEAVSVKDVLAAYEKGMTSRAWRRLPAWFHTAWKGKKIMFASPSTRASLAVYEPERMVWAEGDDMVVLGHTYKGKLTRMGWKTFDDLYTPVRSKS